MTNSGQLEAIGTRNGVPFYEVNPSIPSRDDLQERTRSVKVASGGRAMIVNPGTGELLGTGSVAYMEQESVDPTRFVKLYLEGIRQVVGLSKTGLRVFEMVYAQVQASPEKDQVGISSYTAKKCGIEDRTYRRGLRELLDKKLLFASPVEGVFFINIQYIFNGNRLHFVKSYYKKESAELANNELGIGHED